MPPKKTKVVVAPDEDNANQAGSPADTTLTHSLSVLSTSGGEPKRKASRPEASQGTAARAGNGLDFLDDILGRTSSNQEKTVNSSSAAKTKQEEEKGGKQSGEAPSCGRDAAAACDNSKVGSTAKRDHAGLVLEEEAEEGVSILKDDSSAKAKAAAAKEDALLRQGEELSGEALRKFMMDKFLNFDDDPVSDLEKILGEF